MRLESMLEEHKKNPPEKGAKSLTIQNYKEKEAYLIFEVINLDTFFFVN